MTKCNSLEDVRERIDLLDRRIVALLAERATLVEQAASFKERKNQVVDSTRIEQVVTKVRHLGHENGMDPDLIEHIYRAMIDAFIIHESRTWTKLHGG